MESWPRSAAFLSRADQSHGPFSMLRLRSATPAWESSRTSPLAVLFPGSARCCRSFFARFITPLRFSFKLACQCVEPLVDLSGAELPAFIGQVEQEFGALYVAPHGAFRQFPGNLHAMRLKNQIGGRSQIVGAAADFLSFGFTGRLCHYEPSSDFDDLSANPGQPLAVAHSYKQNTTHSDPHRNRPCASIR